MNKKGFMGEVVLWIPKIIFLSVVLIAIVLIVAQYGSEEVDTKDLDFDVLFNRIFYAKDCVLYGDERIYPGVIDLEKFNEITLNKCFKSDRQAINFSLTDNEVIVNKERYTDGNYLCGIPGPGGFRCDQEQFYVLVKKGDNLVSDLLDITIVMENE